jgi:hypothetical protein
MKTTFILLILILFQTTYPQNAVINGFKLENNSIQNMQNSSLKKEGLNTASSILLLIWPLNPMLVYENKKINFGLTKEASVVFPFLQTSKFGTIGRAGLEYSYIFRGERKSHIRSFFNIDIPVHTGDFVAFTASIGGGYFTDTKKNGIFPQASLNMLVPFGEGLGINPYIKFRHTFMLDKTQSDVTDFSLGIGLLILPFFN